MTTSVQDVHVRHYSALASLHVNLGTAEPGGTRCRRGLNPTLMWDGNRLVSLTDVFHESIGATMDTWKTPVFRTVYDLLGSTIAPCSGFRGGNHVVVR
jgi:hypothetical protein